MMLSFQELCYSVRLCESCLMRDARTSCFSCCFFLLIFGNTGRELYTILYHFGLFRHFASQETRGARPPNRFDVFWAFAWKPYIHTCPLCTDFQEKKIENFLPVHLNSTSWHQNAFLSFSSSDAACGPEIHLLVATDRPCFLKFVFILFFMSNLGFCSEDADPKDQVFALPKFKFPVLRFLANSCEFSVFLQIHRNKDGFRFFTFEIQKCRIFSKQEPQNVFVLTFEWKECQCLLESQAKYQCANPEKHLVRDTTEALRLVQNSSQLLFNATTANAKNTSVSGKKVCQLNKYI